jgi:dihydropteroate synthase
MVNDVRALRAPGALDVVAKSAAAVCLMHMQGDPGTMQTAPAYADVVAEIRAFLQRRASACVDAGIDGSRIVIDPGFGFGKTVAHNLDLLRHLDAITALATRYWREYRARQRSDSSPAAMSAIDSLEHRRRGRGGRAGARILRVHDVRETVDALSVWTAIEPWPGSGISGHNDQ